MGAWFTTVYQKRVTMPTAFIFSKDKWVYVDDDLKEYPCNKADFSVLVNRTKINFDCVFNAIHGAPGEDGTMQAYFDLYPFHIPVAVCIKRHSHSINEIV